MSNSSFDKLVVLAEKCQKAHADLPTDDETSRRWRGLGFQLLDHRFVVPMDQVMEMMSIPMHTRLPGSQPWVVGLANLRGRLLPLIDVATFLGGQQRGQQKRNYRVFLIDSDNVFVGLIVERALGMQRFDKSDFQQSISESMPEAIQPFVAGIYEGEDSQRWHVMDFLSLANDPRFADASLK